jgi:hypothetical protein
MTASDGTNYEPASSLIERNGSRLRNDAGENGA